MCHRLRCQTFWLPRWMEESSAKLGCPPHRSQTTFILLLQYPDIIFSVLHNWYILAKFMLAHYQDMVSSVSPWCDQFDTRICLIWSGFWTVKITLCNSCFYPWLLPSLLSIRCCRYFSNPKSNTNSYLVTIEFGTSRSISKRLESFTSLSTII